jgi:ABC-type transporter Mla subunit MlaD
MRPGGGPPATRFVGLSQPPAVKGGPGGPRYAYRTTFQGDVGALSPGAPVKLRGFAVGEVQAVRLAYDPKTGRLSAPVTLELDPARLGMPSSADRAQLDKALSRWIAQGLRAELAQDPPLVGARLVKLEFAQGARPDTLRGGGELPTIPSAPAGGLGDVGQLTGKADAILAKIDALPIERIGDDVRATTANLRGLTGSPQLQDSIEHLDRTLADVDRTVHEVSPQVKPLVAQLRRAADEIDQTAVAARQVVAGGPASQDGDVPAALHELTETARSVRSLADYLDRHPEALIKGRKGDRR